MSCGPYFFIYLTEAGEQAVLLPPNPAVTHEDIPKELWINGRFESGDTGTAIHLTPKQAANIKRWFSANAEDYHYHTATQRMFYVRLVKAADYGPQLEKALKEWGFAPRSLEELRDRLPLYLYTWTRDDGKVVPLVRGGILESLADDCPRHVPPPPSAIFNARTPDTVRAELFNAWREAHRLKTPFKAEWVELKNGVLRIHVEADALYAYWAERYLCSNDFFIKHASEVAKDPELLTALASDTREVLRTFNLL